MICRDRQGNDIEVYDNPTGFFHFLYDCAAGKWMKGFLINPALSRTVGGLFNLKISKPFIRSFVKKSHIDMTEYDGERYNSYNDFFIRKIKKDCRPIDPDPNHVIAPCDSKLSVFDISDDAQFMIKGQPYTMAELVKDSDLAEKYKGGKLVLFRLCVNDYHRYCYAADGRESMRTMITGVLHSVNPFVAERSPIYKENNRVFSILSTENMGDVLSMEIGAMLVGKIVNHPIRHHVHRGEEKGYFQFGASSIILCFEKDRILLDEDLLKNSAEGVETIVKMGEKIGAVQ